MYTAVCVNGTSPWTVLHEAGALTQLPLMRTRFNWLPSSWIKGFCVLLLERSILWSSWELCGKKGKRKNFEHFVAALEMSLWKTSHIVESGSGEGLKARPEAALILTWLLSIPFSKTFECQWSGCYLLCIHVTNLACLAFLMWLWPRVLWNKSWGLCWSLLREMDHNFLAVGFTGNIENSLHGPLILLYSLKVRKTWSPDGRTSFSDMAGAAGCGRSWGKRL